MKKYIHVIAGLSLALAVTGCANDDDSVVSQAAAAAIQRSQENDNTMNASIAANLSRISALKTAPGSLRVIVTGTVTAGDIAVLKSTIQSLNAPDRSLNNTGAKITLDFSRASFVNNTLSGEAFKYCRKVEKVILPDTVTKFDGWGTFNETGNDCSSFTIATPSGDNTLPSGLTDLGPCAFGWTTNMTEISIPDTVTTLSGTFTGCTSLSRVTIGSGVKKFVDEGGVNGVFQGCRVLSSINYRGTKSQWNAITRGAKTFEALDWSAAPKAKYVQCTDGKVWLNLTSAVATAIAQIEAATAPVTVNFPAGTELTQKDLEAIVEAVKDASQLVTLDFTDTILPGGITYVPAYAFQQCTKLAGITLPATVTSIGQYAFKSTALTSVTIPATVTSIEDQAFANCASLTSVTYGGSAVQFKTAIGSNETTIFPAAIKKVTCSEGAGVTKNYWLGASEAGNTAINAIEAVTTDYAAPTKTVITGILTTKDLELIKDVIQASQCTLYLDMTGATFPGNKVPIVAFSWCAKLVGIDLPTAITQIGQGAFGKCTALTDVTIPAAVTELVQGAFTGCTALATVTFGAHGSTPALNTIGQNCFANCTSLNTVNYWGTENSWRSITKNDGYKTGVNLTTFYVSEGSGLTATDDASLF